MSLCRSCGAQIKWIRTQSNVPMPVNPEVYTFRVDSKGSEVFVTQQGGVLRGDKSNEPGAIRGWISHFATCPYANEHRRRK